MYWVSLFLALNIMWLAFSGYTTPFFLISGALASLLALWCVKRMCNHTSANKLVWHHPKTWLYSIWLLKEILHSSLRVSTLVWTPRPSISPRLMKVNTIAMNDVGKTIYANSITLTPGTICTDIDDQYVEVHALEAGSLEELRQGKMRQRANKISKIAD